ncbi:MAG: hypothetical protein A3I66_12910 [Burkholderiales bacterium RIFCSPLOWO2_02_FULL_57_36]|nr:MAG: hypothetical protein A3I66_12910 [Burkholderiales bacterium RIFCSPLOWO2_02_FULL_57_36]
MKKFSTSTWHKILGAGLVTLMTACGGGSGSSDSVSVATASDADQSASVSLGRKVKVSNPPPAPEPTDGWANCASEGGTCSFSGTKQVRYGANGLYAFRTVTGPVQCTNSVFGDPVPGVTKACAYAATATTGPAPAPTPAPTETWTDCASEGGTCSFSGTRQVRYGANGTYAYRTLTGPVQCTNSVFGDPVYGVAKTCAYSDTTTTTPEPAPAPSPAPADGGRIVAPEFFGMHLAAQSHEGWPSVKFGIQRTWDSWPGVSWNVLNPSAGVYNWTTLDTLVNDSVAHGVELVYVFGHVPQWASTNPSGNCDGSTAGDCYAPQAQAWRDFVAQITDRYKGKIKYWELWNEPNAGNFWKGTHAQLVEMARNAYPIIKNAGGTVLSPSPQGTSSHTWIDAYLSAGGGSYLDIVTFHGYLYGAPETLGTLVSNIRAVQNKHGLSAKPLWDTEHSWGDKSWPMGADQDQQSAWLARYIVLSFFHRIERSFWYGWEHFVWGSLFDRSTDTILKPGIAYREVYNWMIGASFQSCTTSGSAYQCRITRANGYEGLIVWNGSGNSNITVPPGYNRMRTLDATSSAVSAGQVISAGMKPVLIEKPY